MPGPSQSRPTNRLGPALAKTGCRDFKVSFIHASHALPRVYKTSLPLIYEWAGLTRGAEVVKASTPSAAWTVSQRPRKGQRRDRGALRARRTARLPCQLIGPRLR